MDLLDKLVMAIDRRQRRRLGIREFTDDPDCIMRLALTTARTGAELADGWVIRPGDRVGVLHMWNEHIPRMPPIGPDLAWARAGFHLPVHSLRLLARYVVETPSLKDITAFGGSPTFVYTPNADRMAHRLGFELFDPVPPRGPVEWGAGLVMRLWSWLLRRAFNPKSAQGLRLRDFQQRPAWISRRTLIARYGPAESETATAPGV